MRITLVNMPWATVNVPSLALGILTRAVRERLPGVEVDVVHANLDYVDWAVDQTDLSLDDYQYFSLESYFVGCGDWVFAAALYEDPQWRVEEFTRQLAEMPPERMALSRRLHGLAPRFIAELAAKLAADAPDVVGFTSTFQQNTASLAAARALKRLNPAIRTVLGGANCDGPQGAALHRNFPFVDYVIRGEGEEAFPQLVAALRDAGADGPDLRPIPGLCWRGSDHGTVANPMSRQPLPPGRIIAPDYGTYFDRLAASHAGRWAEPQLVVEGARGCWWGEKHHCTFCGLNGSFMEFRSKSPDRFYQEIIDLVRRHQVLDMFVVDNILDMGYVRSLLPRLAESGFDLRLQYEVKSNMRAEHVQALADAGLVCVQPGIENLNSRVLKLMDKGVTGCLNVRMMRDAETSGVTVVWNYLYGFPGETDEDYLDVIAQMPALHHLTPTDSSARIAIERFSPYFNRPELGFGDLRPSPQYFLIYDLPESELMELAYLFEAPTHGIGAELADDLGAALARWWKEYPTSRLTHTDLGAEIVLVSDRRDFDWQVLRLTDPAEVTAFRLLDQPHSVRSVATALHWPEEAARDLLRRWRTLGIVFEEGGQFVQIAPRSANQSLLRVNFRGAAATVPSDLATV